MSDWRDGEDHLDAHWGRIDNPDYLQANVCGGEGYDWYYASEADRDAQIRTPITDGQYDEAWVWRYKDMASWWQNLHFDRPEGVRSREATGWVPGSKPIWFTEYGCAALNKATNQPNKFLDAMSSESVLPYFSTGQRDDAIQAAYVHAVAAYWSVPGNNPVNDDGVAMLDLGRAHVWCWDARPYPAFPARADLWSDGPAWERGHWLNGRAGAVMLSAVVADICRFSGVQSFDVSGMSGVVRGFALQGGQSGRAALQPLMLAYGFDAIERDGVLRFVMRDGLARAEIGADHLAISDDVSGLETVRAPEPEIAGRLRLTHVAAGADYSVATAETSLPDADQESVTDSEFPLVLTRAEGRAIAERWLVEATVSRDTARFALPPSQGHLGPGDVVRLRRDGIETSRWRIDRVERAGAATVDAVRVDSGVYRPALTNEEEPSIRRYVPPMPVMPLFLDLPLLRGDEVPHAPYLAVTAKPWPGTVAAYVSVEPEGGYDLNLTLNRRAVIGRTQNALPWARPGLFDRGNALRIQLKSDDLRSVTQRALLAGANVMAIGDGTSGNWEIIQFASAQPRGNGVWEISSRLRGQAGTDSMMPAAWPADSMIVLLDGAPKQVVLPPGARGQERFWRIGPASRSPDDSSYRAVTTEIRGAGLRPYAPCHLRTAGRRVSWIRRTRIDGDSWDGPDVPLNETREAYLLRVIQFGATLHEVQLGAPEYVIPVDIWQAINGGGAYAVEVAQLSDQYGIGPFVRRIFNADE